MSDPARTPSPLEEQQRALALAAALLFLVSGLTGGLLGAAKQKMIDAEEHTVLAAHMNALLGSLWLLGLAWSLRFSRLGAFGRRVLGALALAAAWGNWAITLVKAFLRVSGVGPTGDRANDAVFVALTLVVVLPTLAGAALWAWGLRAGPRPEGGGGA